MQITVLGCRGSYPVAYPEIMRYGGDTTCVQITAGHTLLVLDAGTGLRKLRHLPPQITEIHLFITHLHWDHIIGLPQWSLLWAHPDMTLHIYGLERSHNNFYRALERSISDPLYSHTIKDIPMKFQYYELSPGQIVELEPGIEVSNAYANHPYRALGYRVQHEGQSFAFVPDTAPFDRYLFGDEIAYVEKTLTAPEREQLVRMEDGMINLIGDSDWLFYDAALTNEEYERLPHWGHSTMDQAVQIARAAGVKELIFAHHDPRRSDDEVDTMLAEQRLQNADMQLSAAFSGMQIGVEEPQL